MWCSALMMLHPISVYRTAYWVCSFLVLNNTIFFSCTNIIINDIIGLNMLSSYSFMSGLYSQLGYSTGKWISGWVSNWLSVWWILTWINHLPPVFYSTFKKLVLNDKVWHKRKPFVIVLILFIYMFLHTSYYVAIWLHLAFCLPYSRLKQCFTFT